MIQTRCITPEGSLSPGIFYTLNYGAFGLRTGIKAGNYTLASYEYTNYQQKLLKKLAYGNGDVVQYTYNTKGQVLTETYTDTGRVITYTYNARGALATRLDSATNILTRYFYDPQGRVTSAIEGTVVGSFYEYDNLGNVTDVTEFLGGHTANTKYGYDNQYRVSSVGDEYAVVFYTYDNLNRIVGQTSRLRRPVDGAYGTATTAAIEYYPNSNRVYKFTTGGKTYTFTYDNNGNIASVSDGTNTTGYWYDSQNQLIREDNQQAGKTFVWAYDGAGNITQEREYAYTTGSVQTLLNTRNYGYATDSWKDRLISYNGKTFTYDSIGNPLSDGTWQYTWVQGRQLVQMAKTGETWNFTYNTDGLRTSRSNGTTTYNYVYNNGQLRTMTVNGQPLIFRYGADGKPYSLRYAGVDYLYILNAQGDVIGIANTSGTQVVTYNYDAWGDLLSVTGSMASTLGQMNPLRYRGYVYDNETGLYYVQTRYYNPEIGRWINADGQISGIGGSLLGYNMFAYCFNNPVNMSDEQGTWPKWAKKLVAAVAVVAVVAAVAAVTVATAGTGTAVACVAVGAAKGAAVGLAMGAATGAASGAVSHRLTTGSWEGAGEAALNGMADGALSGAITGAIAGGMTSNVCFVAGTAVLSSTGYVAIETIEAGDHVWASDPETGEVALKQVVQTFVNEATELVHITVKGEEIDCTTEHPFYSPVKGWTAACKLRAGDILVTVNGEYVVVEKVQHEILESPVKVYNFEVADFHTYYVSSVAILVHNVCKPARITNVSKSESPIWNGFKNAQNGLRMSGTGKNVKYYSWDHLHNEIEVFNRLGKHLGAMDPTTGEFIKAAVKGRFIKL